MSLARIDDIIQKMTNLVAQYPETETFIEDGKTVWPARWQALLEYENQLLNLLQNTWFYGKMLL